MAKISIKEKEVCSSFVVGSSKWLAIERFQSVLWDPNNKGHGRHVGVPNKRSLIFFSTGTPIWRPWRQVQMLYTPSRLMLGICDGLASHQEVVETLLVASCWVPCDGQAFHQGGGGGGGSITPSHCMLGIL